LVLAVMKQESNFNPFALSHRGAYGLMQVMPATGKEVANKLGFPNLRHPLRNITGGTFYLSKLYDLFKGASEIDRLKLSLAAYNAGPLRIYDAQELAAYLGDDPYSWHSVEKALPLLSKRYYTLHQSVWDGGKPRSGYFGKSRQTIVYVRNVLDTYEYYKEVLN
jgi:membrane-bound lytic murein transglycosylase F